MKGKRFRQYFKSMHNPINVGVLNGYAQWAANYPAKAHNPLMVVEEQAMLEMLPTALEKKTCLDLACGSGRYMQHLKIRGAEQIFGVDYSPQMLEQAADLVKYPLVRAAFFPLPFADQSFDLIICGMAVGHEKNLKGILAETARILKPGGLVIYSDLHPFGTLAGWKRTFTGSDGVLYNLEHYLHLYSDHQQACASSGLHIDSVLEPLVGDTAPEFDNIPAVLIVKAFKTLL